MSSEQGNADGQRNAANSAGPKTDEGVAHSPVGAPEQFFSPARFVAADEYSQLVEKRLNDWRGHFRFKTPEEEWVFSQYVVSSVRIERCAAEEPVLRIYAA